MKALATALLKFAENPPAIHSDSQGNFNNKFASLGGLNAPVRAALNDVGLVMAQLPCSIDGQPGLRTILIHAESGEQLEDTMPLVLDKPNMQGFGSALTYARRQSLLAILNLVADADDDANAASRPKPTKDASPAEPPALPVSAGDATTEAKALAERLLAVCDELGVDAATREAVEAHWNDERWLRESLVTAEENLIRFKAAAEESEPQFPIPERVKA